MDDVSKCKNLEELFVIWKQAHKIEDICEFKKYDDRVNKNSFTRDGIICPKEFGKSGKKILLVAKEGHEFDEPDAEHNCSDGVNFWVADGYCERIQGKEISYFLNCLAAYCNAVIMGDFTFDPNKHLDRTVLRNAAFMNINKRGGFKKCPDLVLNGYVNGYAAFINREIELIDPDYIIFCGSGLYDLIADRISLPKGSEVYQAYHPRARGGYAAKLKKIQPQNREEARI